MSKSDWVYLGHMLDMCRKGLEISSTTSRIEYDQDEVLKFALAHIVQMIGEAAAHVSIEFQQTYAEIPWHAIIGMRHRIVHDYMNIDEDVVWAVIQNDLRPLQETLMRVIPPEYQ